MWLLTCGSSGFLPLFAFTPSLPCVAGFHILVQREMRFHPAVFLGLKCQSWTWTEAKNTHRNITGSDFKQTGHTRLHLWKKYEKFLAEAEKFDASIKGKWAKVRWLKGSLKRRKTFLSLRRESAIFPSRCWHRFCLFEVWCSFDYVSFLHRLLLSWFIDTREEN